VVSWTAFWISSERLILSVSSLRALSAVAEVPMAAVAEVPSLMEAQTVRDVDDPFLAETAVEDASSAVEGDGERDEQSAAEEAAAAAAEEEAAAAEAEEAVHAPAEAETQGVPLEALSELEEGLGAEARRHKHFDLRLGLAPELGRQQPPAASPLPPFGCPPSVTPPPALAPPQTTENAFSFGVGGRLVVGAAVDAIGGSQIGDVGEVAAGLSAGLAAGQPGSGQFAGHSSGQFGVPRKRPLEEASAFSVASAKAPRLLSGWRGPKPPA